MAVVTIGDYLQFIGETEVANEPKVTQALAAAEDFANEFCRRTFAKYDDSAPEDTTLVEVFSGNGRRKYFPKQAPIQSVTSIEYWDAGAEAYTAFDSTTHTIVATADRVTFREGYVFPKGSDNLRITYVHGFDTVPARLIRAICLIAQAYAATSTRDAQLKKQVDGEQSFEYFEGTKKAIPGEAESLLQQFVRYSSVRT